MTVPDEGWPERLRAQGWPAGQMWSNPAGVDYMAHRHDYDKVLVVVSGSIRFGLPDTGTSVDLGVGDRLDLPAGTSHDALVGPDGVTCLEAHASAGTLAGVVRRATGDW
jgi:mannose-6-phosphate isomerase-like protein (cupin superfamily)